MIKRRGVKSTARLAAATLFAGAAIALVPALPAAAASCTAEARGGVNSNQSHWISARVSACGGQVRAYTIRLNGDLPPTYSYGLWSSLSTATSPTSGTRLGSGVQSNALSPTKSVRHDHIDSTWRAVTFVW